MKYINFIKGYLYHFLGINTKLSNERKEFCNNCSFNINNKCSACGCWIDAKTRLKTQKCPKNIW